MFACNSDEAGGLVFLSGEQSQNALRTPLGPIPLVLTERASLHFAEICLCRWSDKLGIRRRRADRSKILVLLGFSSLRPVVPRTSIRVGINEHGPSPVRDSPRPEISLDILYIRKEHRLLFFSSARFVSFPFVRTPSRNRPRYARAPVPNGRRIISRPEAKFRHYRGTRFSEGSRDLCLNSYGKEVAERAF